VGAVRPRYLPGDIDVLCLDISAEPEQQTYDCPLLSTDVAGLAIDMVVAVVALAVPAAIMLLSEAHVLAQL